MIRGVVGGVVWLGLILPFASAQKPTTIQALVQEADFVVVGTVRGKLGTGTPPEWRFFVERSLAGAVGTASEILIPSVRGEVEWGNGSKLILFLRPFRGKLPDRDARRRYGILDEGVGAFRLLGERVQAARGASTSLQSTAKLGTTGLLDYVSALIESRKP